MLPWWASRFKRVEQGFTLVETTILVAILGLVGVIAVTNLIGWGPQRRLRSTLTELHSGMNIARVAAMSRNRTVTANISGATVTAGAGGVTVTGTSAAPVTVDVTDARGAAVLPRQVMPSDIIQVIVNPANGGLAQVQFNSFGLRVGVANTTNQLITVTNSQQTTYSVVITPQGRASWCVNATCP
jgi:Tfp pilus assembly protein FimT